MPHFPLIPTPQAIQQAYDEGFEGWLWNKQYEEEWNKFCAEQRDADTVFATIKDSHKDQPRALLYLSREKYDPGAFGEEDQTTGDCQPRYALVRMADGSLSRIEDISEGDYVLTPQGNVKKVTRLIRKKRSKSGTMMRVSFYNDHRQLQATPDHLIQIKEDGELKWVEAKDLRGGDSVVRPSHFIPAKVKHVEEKAWNDEVFCIDVEDDHAFISDGFAVHNCTSHGSRNCRDTTRSVEIHIKGEPEEYFKRGATEPTYGARGHGGQGMDPARAARFERDEGWLVRQNYPGVVDLSKYKSSIGANWGRRGVPEEVKALCRENNVGELVVPKNVGQTLDALANGYAAHSGQNWGTSSKQPKDGINRKSASWSHDMATVGYDISKEFFKEEVLFVANSWGCYDAKTEVLTREGWKHFTEVTLRDEFATLNLSTGELEYQYPSKIHEYDFNGMMYGFYGQGIDLLVTPNHNMVCGLRHRESWSLRRADSLPAYFKMRKSVDSWAGEKIETKEIGNVRISMDDYLELLGWYISEGSSLKKKRKNIYTTADGEEKVGSDYFQYAIEISQIKPAADLDDLIQNRLSCLKFKKTAKGYVSYSPTIYEEFGKLGKQPKRFIPHWVLNLPTEQLQILFNSMMRGDGTKEGQWVYYTSSEMLAGQFQELCLKIGLAADVYVIDRRDRDNGSGGITRELEYQVSIKRVRHQPACKEGWIPTKEKYKGKVYCATVPNHTLYVRRNGKACWSGNSWNQPNPIWLANQDVYGPWIRGMIVIEIEEYERYFVKSGSNYHYADIKGFPAKSLPDFHVKGL